MLEYFEPKPLCLLRLSVYHYCMQKRMTGIEWHGLEYSLPHFCPTLASSLSWFTVTPGNPNDYKYNLSQTNIFRLKQTITKGSFRPLPSLRAKPLRSAGERLSVRVPCEPRGKIIVPASLTASRLDHQARRTRIFLYTKSTSQRCELTALLAARARYLH